MFMLKRNNNLIFVKGLKSFPVCVIPVKITYLHKFNKHVLQFIKNNNSMNKK